MYDQIDGIAMGPPLEPILANIFKEHSKKEWLGWVSYKGGWDMEGYFIIKDMLMIWWYPLICERYVEICCSFGN